ncbi:MAG: FHA domain-containing protein [Polyangiales bacterium]
MSTTVREDSAVEFDPNTVARRWSLVVVHHRSPSVLGLRRVISAGSALDLGRLCGAFGEGALDDPQMSRAHARVELDPRGALTVNDLGSANGTWVDGARVGSAVLRAGAILRAGPVLFAVQHAPETYPVRRSERAPAVAWGTVEFLQALRAALAQRAWVCVESACRSAWIEHAQLVAEERGMTVREARGVEEASGFSLAEIPIVAARSVRASELEAWSASGRALIVDGALPGVDRSRIASMPVLTERVEDLAWVVRAALGRAVKSVPAMDVGFASRLLLGSWPEDVDGVARWAEAIARRPERHEKLVWVGEDLAMTGGPRDVPVSIAPESLSATPAASASADTLVLARDGTWFRAQSEPPVDLRTRIALARILRALVVSHELDASRTLSVEELVDAGWPGEKLLFDSGSNRVYVAIATLRKLGLRDSIERREGGYRIVKRGAILISGDDFERERAR